MNYSRKTVLSWAFYDWANSAFATTVMAGFFPLFFKSYWADPGDPEMSTFYLGIANSTASIIVALFAPFLGAVADRSSSKKKFLFIFAFLGVIMTGSLWIVSAGNWLLAVIFYVSAAVGFSGGNIFYDSLLTGIAPEEKVDFVSSFGFSMGYIGGGLLFLVNVIMYLKPHFFGIPDSATAVRISFLSVAIWWAVFSIPVFLFVKEPVIYKSPGIVKSFVSGWKQLAGTIKQIRYFKIVGLFLLSYWVYIDGVDTIIRMAVDYGMSLGFPGSTMITALLLVQFVAFPAALAYSRVALWIGTKNAILLAIGAYGLITVFAFFMNNEFHFYILAASVGLFQGGIQALSRSFYARLIPVDKSAQFFGFYNMLGKFAAVIGPVLMGSVTVLTGNVRYGIVSIIVLFITGGILLYFVDEKEGQRIAREYSDKNMI